MRCNYHPWLIMQLWDLINKILLQTLPSCSVNFSSLLTFSSIQGGHVGGHVAALLPNVENIFFFKVLVILEHSVVDSVDENTLL